MPGKCLLVAAATVALVLSACVHSPAPAREAFVPTAVAPMHMMPVRQWPLKFKSHSFQVVCYDTYGCNVFYAGLEQWGDEPDRFRPSSASYGPNYQINWNGTHAMIRNFPPPAEVRWRSKDGQPHEAEIDIGAIFQDELIRHHVAREDMADVPDGSYSHEPSIILEVNDRTIRVWMRAHIPTKALQKLGNRYSDYRNDLVLAKTYND